VVPIRKALGIRTFFNMLGPLVNPCRPKRQLVGVFNLHLARLYGYLLQRKEIQFRVVHSLDGYDEVSLTGPFKQLTPQGERIHTPKDLGFEQHPAQALFGGERVEDAARIFTQILDGEGTHAQEQVVLANATLALQTAAPQESLETSREKAKESLQHGHAKRALQTLIACTQTHT
ncbi:MAG: anthranilate phosphoribosyltransferase, partial [Myxococcota bacterium]